MKKINIIQIYGKIRGWSRRAVFLSEDNEIFLEYLYAGIVRDLYDGLIVGDKNQIIYAGITWTKKDSQTLQGDYSVMNGASRGNAMAYLSVSVILDYLIAEKLLT